MPRNTPLFPILLFFLFSLQGFAQHNHNDLGDLIPENTATHKAIKSGDWFEPSTWNTNEVPTEGAIVYIPKTLAITYEGQSSEHIFAIRVDGTFICTQNDPAKTTTLVFDTFIGTHMSTVKFIANNSKHGKIDVSITPFDIEAHKADTNHSIQWQSEAKKHFSDGAATYKVDRQYEGGKRYNSYAKAIADNTTKMTLISRTSIDDGNGVLGRHGWDAKQLSLGLIVMGQLEILGQEKTNMVRLASDAVKGQRTVSLSKDPIGWNADDKVVITRGGNKNAVSNGEDEAQIENITGTTITTVSNLNKNHKGRLIDNLHCYVGNLSRNITFTSTVADDVHQRGHLMAMHNDKNIQIKNAAFIDMGRTDKLRMTDDRYWEKWVEPTVFKSKISALGQECAQMMDAKKDEITNHRGRYSIHLHKTGAEFGAKMVQVTGNVVWGNPGWGITHHDSHANVSENVVYDVTGAGIVSETGSETGFWNNNLVVDIKTGSKESPYIAALFHDDYLFSGQGLAMKGRAVICEGNVIANATNGVGVINMNPAINSVDRVDARQLAEVRPDFKIDQFPLSINGYSKEGDGILPVEVALIMKNTTMIGCQQGLKSIERDMAVNHESRSVFDGFYIWGTNQGLSITYQADYTFQDVFISGKNDEALGAYLWKHSHNHVFNKIKMVDLAYGITVSKLVEGGDKLLKTRNNGFTPWYFIDLKLDKVAEFYEIVKEDEKTTTAYTEHSDNPIHISKAKEVFKRPTTFTLTDNADLAVDYSSGDFKFSIDGIISDDLGTYKMGIEQALAQKDLRNDYPERLYEFASKAKFDEYLMANGVYQHPIEDYKYFIINEVLPNRLTSKYTTFPVRIRIDNAPDSGIFATPKMESISEITSKKQLVSLNAIVTQSSTASIVHEKQNIDCSPEKAIDGNNNGRINAQIFQRGLVPLGSFSQTNQENNPWYDLDLKTVTDIHSIDIWNRVSLSGSEIEKPSAELTDFYVMVSDKSFAGKTLDESLKSATKSHRITEVGLRRFAINDMNDKGQYVRIQMQGMTALSLAEVEIIGSTNICVQDDTFPTVNTKDITLYLNDLGIAEITAADINDASDDNCGIASLEISQKIFTCDNTGENTVTLSVTDTSGNTSSKDALVTILSLPPVISCPTAIEYVQVKEDGTFDMPDYSKYVEDDCTNTLTHVISSGTEANSITVAVIVEDESGNQESCIVKLGLLYPEGKNNTSNENPFTNGEQEVFDTIDDIKISPNPAQDIIQIHAGQYIVDYAEIYDIGGKLIKRQSFNSNEYQIKIGELETATYFLKLFVDNQIIIRQILKK